MKVGIIGTGNIGTDLLIKINRSPYLECGMFAGRNPDSTGIQMARSMGVPVSFESIHAIEKDPDCCEIVFDATSANIHMIHAPILERLGKFTIDLTPARVGRMCIPVINLEECIQIPNVNMITCGGQAIIPIAWTLSNIHKDITYCELVASIASKSAGSGTRNNIDEFTQTTSEALSDFTGIKKTKAVIILNPAEPPLTMRNTLYALIEKPNMAEITKRIREMVSQIQQYVPGYHLIVPPIYENGRVTTTIEVKGQGDFLPEYSGNLDIITSAAIRVAEAYAQKRMGK